MHIVVKLFLIIILCLEIINFLIPITGFFIVGIGLQIYYYLDAGESSIKVMMITAIYPFVVYGLYSLWWLIVMHQKTPVKMVPKYIWVGIFICCFGSVSFVIANKIFFNQPQASMPISEQLLYILDSGGALPLIALTLLLIQEPWKK